MINSIRNFVFIFVVLSSIAPAFSATWNGGGSDDLASNPANWTGNTLPPYGNIIFDGTSSKNCTWDLNENYISIAIESGYTGAVTVNSTIALSGMFQPDGTPIPLPMGCSGGTPTGLAPVMACQCLDQGVCNIGAPCMVPGSCDDGINSSCETTLWHSYNDNTCIPSNISGLNPRAAAGAEPQTFAPAGSLTFKVVSRGTALFQNAFGWYNADGAAPEFSDLHVVLDCNSGNGTTVVRDISSDPAYLGGKIGFFLVTPESLTAPRTCADGDCCASVARVTAGKGHIFYSERGYNPDEAGADSVIHLLIYKSRVWGDKFYFAWNDFSDGSDNDFNDLVTSVSGVAF